jgi:hypothetical protein
MKKQKSNSIELNKVTPLSKLIAGLVFIALPFIGFFWGMRYQQMVDEPIINQLSTDNDYTGHKVVPTTPVKPLPKAVK